MTKTNDIRDLQYVLYSIFIKLSLILLGNCRKYLDILRMNLNELKPHLLYQFKSEAELVTAIEKLSKNFTVSRERIRDYGLDNRLVSAYVSFYLTTNFPKWNQVLDKMEISTEYLADFEILDIGAGPGTFILAALENNPEQDIIGIETSQLMRRQGDILLKAFYPNRNIPFYPSGLKVPKAKKKRMGVFGHSANEMDVKYILDLIDKLELSEVIFIEPGTKEFFAKALEVRTTLIDKGFGIEYPCASAANCPMQGIDNWCHQFIYLRQEDDVQRLTQLVRKDRRLLPQTLMHFKNSKVESKTLKRVVRVYKPSKFSLDYEICSIKSSNSDDALEENYLHDLQQLTRGMKKKQIKELNKIYSGDQIQYKIIKELENGLVRGDIIQDEES